MTDWLTYKGQYPWLCDPVIDKPEYNEGSSITKRSGISGGSPIWKVNQSGPAITPTHIPCGYWTNQYGKTPNRFWYIYGTRWYGPVAYVGVGKEYSTFMEAMASINDNCLYILDSGSYEVDLWTVGDHAVYIKCISDDVYINALASWSCKKLYIEGGIIIPDPLWLFNNDEIFIINKSTITNGLQVYTGTNLGTNMLSNCVFKSIDLYYMPGATRFFITKCIITEFIIERTDGSPVIGECSYTFLNDYVLIKEGSCSGEWELVLDLEDINSISRIDCIFLGTLSGAGSTLVIASSLDGITYTDVYSFTGLTNWTTKMIIPTFIARYIKVWSGNHQIFSCIIKVYAAIGAANISGYGPDYGTEIITERVVYT